MRLTSAVSLGSETVANSFYCRTRRKLLVLDRCLDDFVEANAFENRRSACFRCPQGRRNRESFAGDREWGLRPFLNV